EVITSPCRRPAAAAGEPWATSATSAPAVSVEVAVATPRYGCLTVSPASSSSSSAATRSEGTAKPTPALWSALPSVAIWSTTPITSPSPSSSGPPELPGLTAASVWIAWATVKPLGASIVRSSPETTPVEKLQAYTKGAPIAATEAPTLSAEESPSSSGWSSSPSGSKRIAARSLASSVPSTSALRVLPSWRITSTEVASSTTWAAVTTVPSSSTSKPEPVAVDPEIVDLISTTPGEVAE